MILRALTAASVLSLAVDSVTAQTVRTISGSVAACESCALEVTKIVTIGRATDSVLVMNASTIAADSRGGFYVGPVSTPGAIAVYDSSGALLGTIGRQGSGPGEFGEIVAVWVGHGDTLFVLDARPRRLTVLSPEHRIVRTAAIGLQSAFRHTLPDGRLVIPGRVLSPDRVGRPLHLYAPDGRFLRSFGRTQAALGVRPPVTTSVVGGGQGDQFWVAYQGRYALELWTADGNQPIRTLVRTIDWFPVHEPRLPAFGEDGAPLPQVIGLQESRAGLLWVTVAIADTAWLRSRGDEKFGRETCPPRQVCPTYVPPTGDLYRVFDGRIEIIDPVSARLLMTRSLPGPALFVRPPTGDAAMLSTIREDAGGHLQFDVWSIRLIRPKQ